MSLSELLGRMSDDAETLRRLVLVPNTDNISPIYLAYDASTRSSHQGAIESALERVDNDLKAFSAYAWDINDIEHTLRRRRAKLHNCLQPAAALPVEVVQRILLRAVEPYEHPLYYVSQSPITFSQVCSVWRRAAQSYPLIWTVIRVKNGGRGHYEQHALYSRGLPLELQELKPRPTELKSKDDQKRIIALHTELSGPELHEFGMEYPKFWRDKGVMDCPSIQRLCLFNDGQDIDINFDFLHQFPSLCHLSLCRIFFQRTPQLAGIKSLKLRDVNILDTQFFDLMDACNNLEELALSFVLICRGSSDIPSTWRWMAPLHTLSLEMQGDGMNDTRICLWLAHYNLTNLKVFKFHSPLSGRSSDAVCWDFPDVSKDDHYHTAFPECLRLVRSLVSRYLKDIPPRI